MMAQTYACLLASWPLTAPSLSAWTTWGYSSYVADQAAAAAAAAAAASCRPTCCLASTARWLASSAQARQQERRGRAKQQEWQAQAWMGGWGGMGGGAVGSSPAHLPHVYPQQRATPPLQGQQPGRTPTSATLGFGASSSSSSHGLGFGDQLLSASRSPAACVGVGIVRALDVGRRQLFLLTDVPEDVLQAVDVLQVSGCAACPARCARPCPLPLPPASCPLSSCFV